VLLGGGLVLALVSVVWQLAKGQGWEPASLQLDRILNVDEDLSVLNWLSASTFLLAAVAACAVTIGPEVSRLRWLAAAAVLAFISLDEAAGVHDPITFNAETRLRAGGFGAVAVVLLAALAAAPVALFVAQLAPSVRWRVAGALGLVVVAAVGIDAPCADLVNDPAARLEGGYVAKATLEEVLELGAAVLVLDGMLLAALKR